MKEGLNFRPASKLFRDEAEGVEGKDILITGDTTGIGRSTAILLASQATHVLIFGRHEKELKDAMADIQGAGGQVTGLTADVASPADIRRVFKKVDRQFEKLDILINNAALGYESIMKGDYEDWSYIVHTKLLGYMAVAHEAVERMKAHKNEHIVNIGSLSADEREEHSSVYVATKSGVQGFSEALRKEVNELGIKVSLIEPGLVGTDTPEESPAEQRKTEKNVEILKAEDIAACIYYTLTQPKRCDVIVVQIRPHLQSI